MYHASDRFFCIKCSCPRVDFKQIFIEMIYYATWRRKQPELQVKPGRISPHNPCGAITCSAASRSAYTDSGWAMEAHGAHPKTSIICCSILGEPPAVATPKSSHIVRMKNFTSKRSPGRTAQVEIRSRILFGSQRLQPHRPNAGSQRLRSNLMPALIHGPTLLPGFHPGGI